MRLSRTGIILSCLPGFIMLVLFYSLAVHMDWSLGEWPASIGERGFPAWLIFHGKVTMYFFMTIIWFGMFILPFLILACLFVFELRHFARYLALSALCFGVCWGLMLLAPAPFLKWWRD
jgi:hypothetical protein